MNKLFTLTTGALSYLGSSLAIAHPGHEAGGIIGQAGHAFSVSDYFLGVVLVCIVLYHLIKRTQ